ncbi:hypothetical protein CEXT_557801, partial [Caerostris extrusa]
GVMLTNAFSHASLFFVDHWSSYRRTKQIKSLAPQSFQQSPTYIKLRAFAWLNLSRWGQLAELVLKLWEEHASLCQHA